MSSSDESDDEKRRELAECVYTMPNASKTCALNSANGPTCLPPSNRFLPDQDKQFDYKNLRVPDKLREHVGQHLDQLLSSTEFVTVSGKKKKKKKTGRKQKSESKGVVLLTTSTIALDADHVPDLAATPRVKPPLRHDISDAERKARARQVAVSAESVLSQREVKHWAPETRGPTELLRLSSRS